MELSNEELELFELAYLLRMPVYKLIQEMPYDELLGWSAYFRVRPPEWRADNRAAVIARSFGTTKASPDQLFASLATMKKASSGNSIKNSSIFALMKAAVGGDKLEGFYED